MKQGKKESPDGAERKAMKVEEGRTRLGAKPGRGRAIRTLSDRLLVCPPHTNGIPTEYKAYEK